MGKNKYNQRRKAKNREVREKEAEQSTQPESAKPFNKLSLLIILLVVTAVLAIYWNWPVSNETLVNRAIEDFQAQRYELVTQSVETLLAREEPVSVQILFHAAESSLKMQDGAKAVYFLEQVDDQQEVQSVLARRFAFDILYDMGFGSKCETQLRRALAIAPEETSLNSRMARLLNTLGRRYEADTHLMLLLRENQISWEEIALLANRYHAYEIGDAIKVFQTSDPDDPSAYLTEAKLNVEERQPAKALELLDKIIAAQPANNEARIWQGRALVSLRDNKGFAEWYKELPESAKDHPDYWVTLSLWANDQDQFKPAIRCAWEALKTDPENIVANYTIATILKSGQIDERNETQSLVGQFEQRRLSFYDFQHALDEVKTGINQSNNIKNPAPDYGELKEELIAIAEQLETFGRLPESLGWYRKIAALTENAKQDVQDEIVRLEKLVTKDTPRYLADHIPANKIDFADLPLPQITAESSGETELDASIVSLVDEAKKAGIDFQYYNGSKGEVDCLYLYQVMGGGVGIVDFNLDDLPDIYVVQGCEWPIDENQTRFLDQLYQNLGDGTFREVTGDARIRQNGFGQGVGVGDFNSDGFPDLYVANINGNRLLVNNGDGTYSDITSDSGLKTSGWTASCAVADLNGDQLPDLYDVNYLSGSDVFTKTCGEKEKPFSCPPRDFKPTPDQLWLNLGDGTFREVSKEINLPARRGLGIVVGDMDNNRQLDIFVGNDTDPNLLLLNESEPGKFRLRDVAAEYGVDLADTGEPQACMGIGVFDFNGDAILDLFITNYFKESNTLYVSSGFGYAAGSRKAKLSEPGFLDVGFGTEFIDFELDGDPDLFVANGHVQNYRAADKPFKQSSMLLLNDGKNRFTKVDAGELTSSRNLGRGLAKLDWNRDGLEDFVLTFLDRPLKLITNRSQRQGRSLTLKLIGTDSDRDAIGTRVTITDHGHKKHYQLIAGDGYSVSNQRELVITCSEQKVDSIEVKWTSGVTQVFEDVPSDQRYKIIENNELFTRKTEVR